MSKIRALAGWLWQHKLLSFTALAVVAFVGGVGGTAAGLVAEENDDTCMFCHTQPEYTFWQRTQAAQKPPHTIDDLATFHIVPGQDNKQPQRKALTCISCHGGTNLQERIATEFELGALDTLKFVANVDVRQPAKLSRPLPNSYCLQCHAEDVSRKGFDNHFHNKLEDPKAPPLNCTACHVSHAEADVLDQYILRDRAYPQCNACHQQLGGPINLQ